MVRTLPEIRQPLGMDQVAHRGRLERHGHAERLADRNPKNCST